MNPAGTNATQDGDGSPGVVARPPLIFLGFILAGLAGEVVWPSPVLPGLPSWPVGLAMVAVGVALVGVAARQFRRAGTSIQTSKPSQALVIAGLYRFSRNPIYIGLSLIHAGLGIWAGSLWILAMLMPALLVIRLGVIAREERYLEAKFGDDYRRYRTAVRRWL